MSQNGTTTIFGEHRCAILSDRSVKPLLNPLDSYRAPISVDKTRDSDSNYGRAQSAVLSAYFRLQMNLERLTVTKSRVNLIRFRFTIISIYATVHQLQGKSGKATPNIEFEAPGRR